MATTFKPLVGSTDISTTKTLLHEAIPITGTIISGTYADNNVKNYSHGMFQSVYDYPYLSSSANHIFDITIGYSDNSALSGAANRKQNAKKINLYNQMAAVLVGYDRTGSIQEFDQDGNISAGGTKIREAFFLSFSRLLFKDEIKKGTFSIAFMTSSNPTEAQGLVKTLGDYDAATNFRVNSPAGEFGVLYTASSGITTGTGQGLIYYQAGVIVLSASIFPNEDNGHVFDGFGPIISDFDTGSVERVMSGSNISSSADGLRNRWKDCSYNNTVELNSTVYFCRAAHNEFNYTSNPTYLTGSKIRVKNVAEDAPISYITTIGLYAPDNELMAMAKLSEPLKKDPSNELTLRVRLDY
tara:strand:- start:670 stop:1734 length:1065 start_codon:yes stop_codon:yes gene_type:complete